MLHSDKRLPRAQLKRDYPNSSEGFALVGALLLVLTISVAVPQLLTVLKDVNKRGAKDQAAMNAAEFSKSIFATTHAQFQAHAGLPRGWATWSSLTAESRNNLTPCLKLLENSETTTSTIATNWKAADVRYSFVGHEDDNSTYSFGAIRFEEGAGAVINPFETYEIFGCYVRGQPLPAAGIVKGTYIFSGGRLRMTDLTSNNI